MDIIERFSKAYYALINKEPLYVEYAVERADFINAAKRLRDELEKEREWISVEDRLPEYGIKVIAYRNPETVSVEMRLYCNAFIGLQDKPHPTHWKPLPKTPNSKEEV